MGGGGRASSMVPVCYCCARVTRRKAWGRLEQRCLPLEEVGVDAGAGRIETQLRWLWRLMRWHPLRLDLRPPLPPLL